MKPVLGPMRRVSGAVSLSSFWSSLGCVSPVRRPLCLSLVCISGTKRDLMHDSRRSMSSGSFNIRDPYVRYFSDASKATMASTDENGSDAESTTTSGGSGAGIDMSSPPAHVTELVDEVFELNKLEVEQLVRHIQTQLGVPDAALSGGGSSSNNNNSNNNSTEAAEDSEVVEKDVFDVKMKAFDAKSKIKIIKEVRSLTELGLKEAKELVEGAPCVLKAGLKKEEADEIKKLLEGLGAEIELT